MKLQEIERNIETTGVLSEGDYGISTGDQAHILTILRDKLYSDKFLAIVREYSTNAWDAHMEAGLSQRPIKVTSPTRWEPTFSVRDYGKGLSREDIYSVYAKYGRSTKRNSNDVIGQLGLGCKSAFAYNNTFTIISYYGGFKTTYISYIDESNVGKIKEFQTVPSDETGVEIQIPIRAADVDAIKDRIQKLLPYFEPIPECNLQITRPEYSVSGTSWAIRTEYAGGPCAVMGNVPYPIEAARLPELNQSGKEILECGIDIRFPIGELSISASREALEYTDSTRTAIYKKLAVIRNEVLASLRAEFDACPNIWEARMLYQRTQRTMGSAARGYGYNSRNIVASLAAATFRNWNGKPLTEDRLSFEKSKGDKLEVRLLNADSKRATDAGTSDYRKIVTVDNRLIVLKNNVKSAWLKRVLFWRDSNRILNTAGNAGLMNMLVIDFKEDNLDDPAYDQQIAQYLEANNLTGIRIVNAADMLLPEEAPASPNGPPTTRPVNLKAKAKVFTIASNYEYQAYPASKNWTPAEADLEEGSGVYVVIHAFVPQDETEIRSQLLRLLFAVGYDTTTTPIYGIRAEMKDKLGDQWVELLPWGKEQAKALLQVSPLRDPLVNYYISTHFSLGHSTRNGDTWKAFLDACVDTRIKQAAAIIAKAESQQRTVDWATKNKYSTIIKEMQGDIMGDISTSIKIVEDVEKEYPLIKELEMFHGGGYFRTTTWPQHLAKYVELVFEKK